MSSRTLLTAALAPVHLRATSSGGTAHPATHAFSGVSDAVLSDFKGIHWPDQRHSLRERGIDSDIAIADPTALHVATKFLQSEIRP